MSETGVCRCGHMIEVHDGGAGACGGVFYHFSSPKTSLAVPCGCSHFVPYTRGTFSDARLHRSMLGLTPNERLTVENVVEVLSRNLKELRE